MIARASLDFRVQRGLQRFQLHLLLLVEIDERSSAITLDSGGDRFLTRVLYLFPFRLQQVFVVFQPSLHRPNLGFLAGRKGHW